MKKRTKGLLICGAAVLVIALLAVYAVFGPKPEEGVKHISVTVAHDGGGTAEFQYATEAEYLGQILLEAGLIAGEQGQYGLFVTTVDGETADAARQQWWRLTQNGGETVETGVDMTPLSDGACYELTLMTGW